jgi:hypothetical protein
MESPVHEIVNALWRALHALRAPASTEEVERWGFSIHGALSAAGREFHNHDHVIELAREVDPLEVIAALYHDAVYIQVDHGPPPTMASEIATVLDAGRGGEWQVLPASSEAVSDVHAVFGRKPGDIVTATSGLNELASALVACVQLEHALDRYQRINVVAAIEQTIPFRVDPVGELKARLQGFDLSAEKLDETMRRAVRVGNRDVDNFADNDAARFLDSTWKLLPESNPALHSPMVYTVRDYRIALQKMEGFLAWLPADRVFHAYADEPKPEATCVRSSTRSRWSRRSPRSPAVTCRSTISWVESRTWLGPRPSGSSSSCRTSGRRIVSIFRCTDCCPRGARRSRDSTRGRRRWARTCIRRSARRR